MVGTIIAVLLIIYEIGSFASVDLVSTIDVDLDRNREILVSFDISFRKMACKGTSPQRMSPRCGA